MTSVVGTIFDCPHHRVQRDLAASEGLSQLPLEPPPPKNTKELVNMFHMAQVDLLPGTSEEIAIETGHDPAMSRVYDMTLKGRANKGYPLLVAYSSQHEQLTVN